VFWVEFVDANRLIPLSIFAYIIYGPMHIVLIGTIRAVARRIVFEVLRRAGAGYCFEKKMG